MLSRNAIKNVDNCRFCWMCRHLCPVGLKTGKEMNTPRAKALILSLVERGTPFDADMVRAMYECVLCGACTNDCVTGFDPVVYIREARSAAVVDGLLPPGVEGVLKNIQTTGRMYGKKLTAPKAGKDGGVLLYAGEAALAKTPEMVRAYSSLLEKAGIGFSVLEDEPPSGTFLGDLIGLVDETRKQAKACADVINAAGAKTVVVLDPWEAATLIQKYPEWGFPIKAEVKTATAFIASLLEQGKLKVKAPLKGGTVSYHDSTRLARDLDEHTPARLILERLGFTVKEMFQHKRLAKCCGSSLFKAYAPDLASLTARGRWEDFVRTGAETLVTACPESYEVLSGEIPAGKKLVDLFTLLDSQ